MRGRRVDLFLELANRSPRSTGELTQYRRNARHSRTSHSCQKGKLKGIRIVRLKAGTFTKTIENALRQGTVVTIKVVTASGADDLCLSLKEPTRGVILVSAIEALNHCRIDRRERRLGWQRLLAWTRPNQSGYTNFEIGCRGQAEER
jgi:hypothetical protein